MRHRRPPPAPAPQIRTGGTLHVSGPLLFPRIAPASAMAVRGQALGIFARTAVPTTTSSLRQFFRNLPAAQAMLPDHPGLHDYLCAYLPQTPADPERLRAKARREFIVHARMTPSAAALLSVREDDFLAVLLAIHRRLGTGENGFRTHAVATAPDQAENRVVYPHHRQCLTLLRDLHLYLAANASRHPALCAAAAYVAINRAHPSRTATAAPRGPSTT